VNRVGGERFGRGGEALQLGQINTCSGGGKLGRWGGVNGKSIFTIDPKGGGVLHKGRGGVPNVIQTKKHAKHRRTNREGVRCPRRYRGARGAIKKGFVDHQKHCTTQGGHNQNWEPGAVWPKKMGKGNHDSSQWERPCLIPWGSKFTLEVLGEGEKLVCVHRFKEKIVAIVYFEEDQGKRKLTFKGGGCYKIKIEARGIGGSGVLTKKNETPALKINARKRKNGARHGTKEGGVEVVVQSKKTKQEAVSV